MGQCVKCGGEAHHSYGFDASLGLSSSHSTETILPSYASAKSYSTVTNTYRTSRHEGFLCSQCISHSTAFTKIKSDTRKMCIGFSITCAICLLVSILSWNSIAGNEALLLFVLGVPGFLIGTLYYTYTLLRMNNAIKHNKPIRVNDGARVLLEYEQAAGKKIDTYFTQKKNKWPKG